MHSCKCDCLRLAYNSRECHSLGVFQGEEPTGSNSQTANYHLPEHGSLAGGRTVPPTFVVPCRRNPDILWTKHSSPVALYMVNILLFAAHMYNLVCMLLSPKALQQLSPFKNEQLNAYFVEWVVLFWNYSTIIFCDILLWYLFMILFF